MEYTDNQALRLAFDIVETTDTHLFLTGRAGTGKTTFLRELRKATKKRMAVLAPTGIAAMNAHGVTLHSFFQLPFGPYVPGATLSGDNKRYTMTKQKIALIKSVDLLVIDEISMVRADLLDAVDNALQRYRNNYVPFGGVQLLLIGDLQQLAPVAKDDEWQLLSQYYESPYFFSSRALQRTNFVTVELEKVYRQSDAHFLGLLNNIRECVNVAATLQELNKRCNPAFVPDVSEGYVRLVTHNWQAQQVNERELARLGGPVRKFDAKVGGKFPEYSFPTEQSLELKVGAQVMFVKNDSSGEKRYFNGMLGKVSGFTADGGINVRPDNGGSTIEVGLETWRNTHYALDDKTKEIKEVVDGKFEQYPIKLAWAITIHKSQGLTFDRVMIDASASFAHGQTYVALSRCRTLEGIVLTSRIPESAIIEDKLVKEFTDSVRRNRVTPDMLAALRDRFGANLLMELFSFGKERMQLAQVVRLMQEFLSRTYADTTRRAEEAAQAFDQRVTDVADTFQKQYSQILHQAAGNVADAHLQDRVAKACGYFERQLNELNGFVEIVAALEIDNKETLRRRDNYTESLLAQLAQHTALLSHVAQCGFAPGEFMSFRAKLLLQADEAAGGVSKGKPAKAKKKKTEDKFVVPTEVKNAALYERLREWRLAKATEEKVAAFVIMGNKALMTVANHMPVTLAALKKVPYFGDKRVEKYGEELIRLIAGYIRETGE